MFDSLIHLQDSQTSAKGLSRDLGLIHLFTYKTLKPGANTSRPDLQFDSLIHLQDSQTKCTRVKQSNRFDSLIHLQDSQTNNRGHYRGVVFDSLIHLQDSQTIVDVARIV